MQGSPCALNLDTLNKCMHACCSAEFEPLKLAISLWLQGMACVLLQVNGGWSQLSGPRGWASMVLGATQHDKQGNDSKGLRRWR